MRTFIQPTGICLALLLLAHSSLLAQEPGYDDKAAERSEKAYLEGLVHFQRGIRSGVPSVTRRHFEKALEHFTAASSESPAYRLALHYQGVALGKLGRYQESLQPLRQLVVRYEQEPAAPRGLSEAYQDLAVSLYGVERFQESLSTLEKGLELDSANGSLHLYQGLCRYRLGDFQEAAGSFREAIRHDPSLETRARYHLGLALLALGERQQAEDALNQVASADDEPSLAESARELLADPAAPPPLESDPQVKRWQLRLTLGGQFDSNVILRPEGGPVFSTITDETDFRFSLAAGGSFRPWNSQAGYLRADYDFFQAFHLEIDDFDVQAHEPRLEAGIHLTPNFTLGARASVPYFRLGGEEYLRQASLRPFLRWSIGSQGLLEGFYQFTDQDYKAAFFDPERDGNRQQAGLRYYWLKEGFQKHFYFGYQYFDEDPDSSQGNDFQYSGNIFEAGLNIPLRGSTSLRAGWSLVQEDYEFPISFDLLGRMRDDDRHRIHIEIARPLNRYLQLRLGYLGIFNNSSIEIFEYKRNIGSFAFQFTF